MTLKNDKGVYSGYAVSVASSIVTDDLDLLLGNPMVVQEGQLVPMPDIESVLIRREDILSIVVHQP